MCLAAGLPLQGYAAADWLRILALTLLAQLLGHSLFNLVLRSTSPTLVSLATLFTVPTAAVLAALLLGQTPGRSPRCRPSSSCCSAFDVMAALGADTVLVCSSVSPLSVDDDDLAAEQLCTSSPVGPVSGVCGWPTRPWPGAGT